MTYSDFVSYLVLVLLLPSISTKFIFNLIPIALAVWCAKKNHDRSSNFFLTVSRKYSNLHNNLERKIAHGLSMVLHPIKSYRNYKKNRKIIKLMRKHAKSTGSVKFDKLPSNIRHAIQKEGPWEVYFQMLVMFSVLPTIKHTFMNNPYLFQYQIYLTNQISEQFNNQEKMCHIFFSYINDPAFILKFDPDRTVDQISFTPNYYNDPADHQVDHNQIGLQISTYFSTLIFLDTLSKDGTSLYQDLIDQKYDASLMHHDYPIYQEIAEAELEILHRVEFDPANRVKLLDLVLPYDHHYHLVSGMVEANIRNNDQLEHPMLCIYHQGDVMVKFWNEINRLFEENVMGYLKSLEQLELANKD